MHMVDKMQNKSKEDAAYQNLGINIFLYFFLVYKFTHMFGYISDILCGKG